MDSSTATLTTPHAVVESQVAKTAERKPSISSLNPSTSRFTLKLPLLGRPKIPLEQAVAVAQAEDIRDPDGSTGGQAVRSVIQGDELPTNRENIAADTGTPSEPVNQESVTPSPRTDDEQVAQVSPLLTNAAEQSKQDALNLHKPRAASWWGYIGWTGQQEEDLAKSQAANQQASAECDSQPHDPPTTDNSQVGHQEPSSEVQTTDPPELAPVAEGTVSFSPSHDIVPLESGSGAAEPKPSSVFSSETVKSHGSAWYSPWAWYPASPAAGSSTQGDANAVTDKLPAAVSESPQTESERVKEEALAREVADSAPSSEPMKPPSSPECLVSEPAPKVTLTSPESPNPIESSIADNRSGWMSFFMSKTLVVKSVANESHSQQDDGMEVMEIDDAPPESSAAIEIPTGNSTASPLKSPSAAALPLPSSAPKSPTSKSPIGAPPKEREPRKPDAPAVPLTDSDSIKRDTAKDISRAVSPTPSKASGTTSPNSARAVPPNFVLPTWEDTFHTPPRSHIPPRHQNAKSKLTGALSYVAGAFFSKDERAQGKTRGKGKGKQREEETAPPEFVTFGRELPKALDVLGEQLNPYMLNGGCRVVVIGVAGWSPGAVTRTLAGGLPSSSSKFVNMTAQALEQFADENGFKFKKITRMPLEGDGTIRKKVSKVYNHLVDNEEWMEDLHAADVIFVASHSQGAIVSTHLVHRLIEDGHILTSRSVDVLAKSAASIAAGGAAAVSTTQAQRVCLLALCGIHLGPLRYLKTSSLQLYIQYVENAAARELFEFQDTESKLSKNYIFALRNVMEHGACFSFCKLCAKVVYIASLNDQVVPIYSGLFTAASHPRILRALYIDNDAYHSSDFLSNLLILLIRILNAGLSDRGLLAHLSEATAGTLSGVGHSTAYEEPATYSLAVKYFFSTNEGTNVDAELVINPFNAVEEQNDYEIPWLLRDMIADTRIAHFFAREFSQLRDAFDDWQPKTTILRDVKRKLQPITRLSTIQPPPGSSLSKL
ncbi:hypothetical protein BC628DRAFT_1330211 [Trametes gibbosa]|nr:hypothetical protein BC628DRAFT_1330211 [Trametes gibbosa]